MTVKSIMQIDLDDSSFKAFHGLFQQYQEELARMPQQWQDVSKGTRSAASHFEGIAATASAYSKAVEAVRKAGEANHATVVKTGNIWHTMARDTKNVAAQIDEITRSLLKWSAITGVVSGLLGGGGLWGISRLAQSAAVGRQQANGLDVSYGQNRAFAVNYQRFLDNPSATLGAVYAAKRDITSPQYQALIRAGFTDKEIQSSSVSDLAAQILPRSMKAINGFTRGKLSEEGTALRALGLDNFVNTSEIDRYRTAGAAERGEVEEGRRRDSSDLNVSDPILKKWQGLTTQLDRAGETIEAVFIKGLVPLAPQIEKLSGAVTGLVGDILGSDGFKRGIESLATGIKDFAGYLASPEFKKELTDFGQGVKDLVTGFEALYRWIKGKIGGEPAWKEPSGPYAGGRWQDPHVKDHGWRSRADMLRRHRGRHPFLGEKPGSPVNDPDFLQGSQHDDGTGAFVPGYLHKSAFVMGREDQGSSSAIERFARSFMLMILAAERVTAEFNDLAKATNGLLNNGGTSTSVAFAGGTFGGVSIHGVEGGKSLGGRTRLRGRSSGGGDYGSYSGSPSGKINGDLASRADRLMDRLINVHGWSPAAAAIAAGNAEQESGIRSDGPMGDPSTPGGSWAMFQWNNGRNNDTVNGRLARLKKFAGGNWRDFDANVDFMAKEAERMIPGWKGQKDLNNAGRIGKLYEGYGDDSTGTRVNNARKWLHRYLTRPHSGGNPSTSSSDPSRGGANPIRQGLDAYHGIKKQPHIEIRNNTGANATVSAHLLTIGT